MGKITVLGKVSFEDEDGTVEDLSDVETMIDVIGTLGAKTDYSKKTQTIEINTNKRYNK